MEAIYGTMSRIWLSRKVNPKNLFGNLIITFMFLKITQAFKNTFKQMPGGIENNRKKISFDMLKLICNFFSY